TLPKARRSPLSTTGDVRLEREVRATLVPAQTMAATSAASSPIRVDATRSASCESESELPLTPDPSPTALGAGIRARHERPGGERWSGFAKGTMLGVSAGGSRWADGAGGD